MLFDDDMEPLRYFGAMAEDGEDAARKAEERDRKKAEVRKRLEEAGQKKNKKKGFLTPERKKKLRKLLMMKAAEDLKQQQLLKEQERQKALQQRVIALPDVDPINDQGKLLAIYEEMFARLRALEEEKYDISFCVARTESEINELTIAVNDLRGKYVKPALKKVSKYDNKFKKMGEEGGSAKGDFRANLKVVKKESGIEDIIAKTSKKEGKPDWSKKPTATVDGVGKEKKDDDQEASADAPADSAEAEGAPEDAPSTDQVEEENEVPEGDEELVDEDEE